MADDASRIEIEVREPQSSEEGELARGAVEAPLPGGLPEYFMQHGPRATERTRELLGQQMFSQMAGMLKDFNRVRIVSQTQIDQSYRMLATLARFQEERGPFRGEPETGRTREYVERLFRPQEAVAVQRQGVAVDVEQVQATRTLAEALRNLAISGMGGIGRAVGIRGWVSRAEEAEEEREEREAARKPTPPAAPPEGPGERPPAAPDEGEDGGRGGGGDDGRGGGGVTSTGVGIGAMAAAAVKGGGARTVLARMGWWGLAAAAVWTAVGTVVTAITRTVSRGWEEYVQKGTVESMRVARDMEAGARGRFATNIERDLVRGTPLFARLAGLLGAAGFGPGTAVGDVPDYDSVFKFGGSAQRQRAWGLHQRGVGWGQPTPGEVIARRRREQERDIRVTRGHRATIAVEDEVRREEEEEARQRRFEEREPQRRVIKEILDKSPLSDLPWWSRLETTSDEKAEFEKIVDEEGMGSRVLVTPTYAPSYLGMI